MPDSPLRPCYEHQAKLMEFASWILPAQFSGLTREHQAVRHQAGLFDISHMGQVQLRGPDVLVHLDRLVPSALVHLSPGMAKYTLLLNEQGGIVDDVIVYVQGEAEVKLIVNAACTTKDVRWLQQHLPPTIQLEQQHQALLALQGPQATALLQTVTDTPLGPIPRFGHALLTTPWGRIWAARTGYTGEDGWEIQVAPEVGRLLWSVLVQRGATPCGLVARDVLRLEAGLLLYGQDMNESTTPLAAGLDWVVDWHKGEFIGRAALQMQKQAGVAQKLVGLWGTGRRLFRTGYPVLAGAQLVGHVTSGTWSPSLGRPIGLAYVDRAWAQEGTPLTVQVRDQRLPVTVGKRTFYRRGG